MKKIIPLIFSVFYLSFSNGQAVGGWGNCEFATIAAMNAFDPSTNAYDCKKVFVQATNEHYHWDGTQWVLDGDSDNIYNTDGTLTEDRTMDMDGNDLTFDGSKSITIQNDGKLGIGTNTASSPIVNSALTIVNNSTNATEDDIEIATHNTSSASEPGLVFKRGRGTYTAPSNILNGDRMGRLGFYGYQSSSNYNLLSYISSNYRGNGSNNLSDLSLGTSGNDVMYLDSDGNVGIGTTIVDAKLDVEGGSVRFSDYGSGTNTGTATQMLAVDSDGDIIEEDLTNSSGTGVMDNIYTADGVLQSNRIVDMDGNDLTFDGTSNVVIQSDGDVGIGVTPTTQFDVDGIGLFRNGSGWNNAGNNGQIQFGFDGTTNHRHAIKSRHSNTNNAYNGLDFFVWQFGVDATADLASSRVMTISGKNSGSVGIGTHTPDAKLEVKGGNVRFTDYGSGTYDDASPEKLLGVQSDGDVVEVDFDAMGLNDNIYTIDGTLEEDRNVDMDGNDLTFDGTSDVIIQSDGDVGIGITPTTDLDVDGIGLFRNGSGWNNAGNNGQIQFGFDGTTNHRHAIKSRHSNTNNAYNGLDFFVWQFGVDATADLASSRVMTISAKNSGSVGIGTHTPDAKLEVKGGNVRFTDYGSGTYDDASPEKLLGVQSDGDVVEVDFDAMGLNDNIYTIDGTLEDDRTVDMDGNDLTFDGTSDVVIQSDGDVGIGVTPTTQFDVDGIGLFRNGSGWNNAGNNGQIQFGFDGTTNHRHAIKSRHSNTNNSYNGLDFFVWQFGVDATTDLASSRVMTISGKNSGSVGIGTHTPDAKLEVKGGNVRFTDYGSGTYDDASPEKLLGVNSNGDVVEVDLDAQGLIENIYNVDGILEEDRIVDMDGNDLTFDGTSDVVIQSDGDVGIGITPTTDLDVDGIGLFRNGSGWNNAGNNGQIQFGFDGTTNYRHAIKSRHNDSNNAYNGLDFFVWQVGVDATADLASSRVMTISGKNSGSVGIGTHTPDAKLEVKGGNVRFSEYGSGTNTGTATRLLAVDTDGDIIEEDLTNSSGTGAFDNIYSKNGIIQANRIVDLDGKTLTFQGVNSDVFIEDTGKLGVGTTTPEAQLEVNYDRNSSFTGAEPDDGKNSFLSSIVGTNENAGSWSRTITGLTPNVPDGSVSGLFTFGQGDAQRQAGHMYFVDTGADGDEYIGFAIRSGAWDILNLTGNGDVGIGTNTPNAKLDVDNGSVRFSDYGIGTYDDASPSRILGVQTNGDVVEVEISSLGDNLGNHIAKENLQMNDFWISNDGENEGIYIESDGDVGIGTSTPTGQLHVINDENVNGFLFESGNNLTGEKDVFTIQDKDVGGGGQDKSSVLKVYKSANINAGDTGTSLIETTYTGTDPGKNKYWISGRKTDEGAPEWGVNISDNQIWSKGGILLNASSNINGSYSDGDFIVETDGDVGIGTNSPATRLEVDGGTVRFSDYGGGTNTGTETYMLGVDTDGDIIEMNTAKSSKIFYPPAIAVPADTEGDDFTLDLHQQYVTLFGSPAVPSTGAPTSIPTYGETELYYYVTDYDTDIFENVSINANGVMEYDVKEVPSDNCSFINVVFVVK